MVMELRSDCSRAWSSLLCQELVAICVCLTGSLRAGRCPWKAGLVRILGCWRSRADGGGRQGGLERVGWRAIGWHGRDRTDLRHATLAVTGHGRRQRARERL